VIHAQDLVKTFGTVKAVDGVSFDVREGEIFAFLGPNGAGKTTTIQMLTTLQAPTSGSIRIDGLDPRTQPHEVRRRFGIVFQDPSLDGELTALENLELHGVLYHVPRKLRNERAAMLLKLFELWEKRDAFVKTFSGGMKRRLEIARGLLHYPKVLFLDEPTLGLDVQTRIAIWQHVRKLRDEVGTTVFMTTHYMDEAENCDRIAIIDHGKIQAIDTPAALKRLIGGDKIIVGGDPALEADMSAKYDVDVQKVGGELHFQVASGAEFVPRLIGDFGGRVKSVQIKQPSLEDVFLKLTGHGIRAEEGSSKDLERQGIQLWRGGGRGGR